MESDPAAVLSLLVAAFETLQIPYLVGGSVASSLHGEYRATADVDVVADLRENNISPLAALLEPDFYVDTEMMKEEVRRCGSFNILFKPTIEKVDIFVLPTDPWAKEQMRRRREERLTAEENAPTAYFCTPEDIILQKLHWYRIGGEASLQQLRDVTGVLKVQWSKLDNAYLDRWAAQLGIADLLAQAREDSGLI